MPIFTQIEDKSALLKGQNGLRQLNLYSVYDIEAKDIYAAPWTLYRHIHDIMESTLQSIITIVIYIYVY